MSTAASRRSDRIPAGSGTGGAGPRRSPSRRSSWFTRAALRGGRSEAEARDDVVVDDPRRLHERVADGRPDEAEAAALQLLAHRLRDRRLGRDLADRLPAAHERLAV